MRLAVLLLLVMLLPALAGCSLIYVGGSGNTISNANNRGGLDFKREVEPAAAKPSLIDRLRGNEAH